MALLYAMGSKESTDMLREEKSSDLHQNCTVYGGAYVTINEPVIVLKDCFVLKVIYK